MKLPHVVKCNLAPDLDEFSVEFDGVDVMVYAARHGEIVSSLYLTPERARRLAKALKTAAKRAEAVQ